MPALRVDAQGVVHVSGTAQVHVKTIEEAKAVLLKGVVFRTTKAVSWMPFPVLTLVRRV